MAFKVVILALAISYVSAGDLLAQPALRYSPAPAVSSTYFQQASAPIAYEKYATPAIAQHVAYQAAPAAVAVQAPSVGITQQTLSRSLGGAQSLSSYSKSEDSAFSSVRKYDTRFTNDLSYGAPLITKAYAAPAPISYAPTQYITKTYGAPAPVVSYASQAPLITKTYGAPSQLITKTYGAPVVSYGAPAQLVTKTYGSPVVSYGAPAPVLSYGAPGPIVTKTYGAPAAYATSGPVVSYDAPGQVITKTYGAPSPVLSYGAPGLVAKAPVVAKAAVAYSPAGVVAHTNFQGYGIEYHY